MIRTIWRTTLFVLLWTLIAGIIYCAAIFTHAVPSVAIGQDEAGFGMSIKVLFWLFIVPPLSCFWLVAVYIQTQEVRKLRGHRCKEGDELEKALATQFLTLFVSLVGWGIAEVFLYVGLFAHYIAAAHGIFRYMQLRSTMNKKP